MVSEGRQRFPVLIPRIVPVVMGKPLHRYIAPWDPEPVFKEITAVFESDTIQPFKGPEIGPAVVLVGSGHEDAEAFVIALHGVKGPRIGGGALLCVLLLAAPLVDAASGRPQLLAHQRQHGFRRRTRHNTGPGCRCRRGRQ